MTTSWLILNGTGKLHHLQRGCSALLRYVLRASVSRLSEVFSELGAINEDDWLDSIHSRHLVRNVAMNRSESDPV